MLGQIVEYRATLNDHMITVFLYAKAKFSSVDCTILLHCLPLEYVPDALIPFPIFSIEFVFTMVLHSRPPKRSRVRHGCHPLPTPLEFVTEMIVVPNPILVGEELDKSDMFR